MTRLWPKLRSQAYGVLPLGVVAASLLVAGCGSDSGGGRLLSRQQASDLRAKLTQVEQDVAAKDCTGAGEEVAAFQGEIDSIKRLDRKLRSALRASARRLETLVSADCETTTTPTTTTPTTPTTPDEGATGATGTTGSQDENQKKPKKPKKEKKAPPGQDEQAPSDQGDGGGGAVAPDELNPDGGTNP
jgi:outer membrane murein-binding lipoprotein Lpp